MMMFITLEATCLATLLDTLAILGNFVNIIFLIFFKDLLKILSIHWSLGYQTFCLSKIWSVHLSSYRINLSKIWLIHLSFSRHAQSENLPIGKAGSYLVCRRIRLKPGVCSRQLNAHRTRVKNAVTMFSVVWQWGSVSVWQCGSVAVWQCHRVHVQLHAAPIAHASPTCWVSEIRSRCFQALMHLSLSL